jgi:anti-sigma B factor antagonist
MAVRRFPLRGEVDLATVPDLQTKLEVLVNATDDDLVLDCTGLEFIDSTGIGMVVYAHQALGVLGRRLMIENLSARAQRPFDVLGLTGRLGIGELDPA